MQRLSYGGNVNEADSKLGDVLGVVEGCINDGNRLMLTVGSRLNYDNLANRLFSGSYVVVVDSTTNSEALLRVNRAEGLPNPPPSIRGLYPTYIKVLGEFVIARVHEDGNYRYVSTPVIPTSGSLIVYPGGDVIREFLGIDGDVIIGSTTINGYRVPIAMNSEFLGGGLLVVGQPRCGKSLLIKRLIKGLYMLNKFRNIIILDRTGEYPKYLIENGLNTTLILPLDLMKLGRPVDIDELRRYVIDKLRMLGFRSKVRVNMVVSKNHGIKLRVQFRERGYGSLSILPSSIRFAWFIRSMIKYMDSDIKYVVTTLMTYNDKALNSINSFINAIKDPEFMNTIGRRFASKALDLAYSLSESGYFDAVVNVGGNSVDLSIYSPIRGLSDRLVVVDLHEVPIPIMDIYEVALIEDFAKWFMSLKDGKVAIILDNMEGLIGGKFLNAVINLMRVSKAYGLEFIMATRVPSRRLYREVSNVVLMRMGDSQLNLRNCLDSGYLLNGEFVLISPSINVGCLKGTVA